MQLYRPGALSGVKLNIASLIDVFFLLIIFFMTVSQMTSRQMQLELPAAQQGQAISEKSALKQMIFNITSDGRIYVFQIPLSLEKAGKYIDEEIRNRSQENIEVLIRAEKQTKWQYVAELMDICSRRKITKVRVAVVEAERYE